MSFERFFRFVSYAAVFCGFFSLWVSGTFGPVGTLAFVGILAAGWLLEDTRFQVSERLGTVLILLSLPAFYLLWRLKFFGIATVEAMLPAVLSRMILTLTAIKLLQKKSERDWIFLYLMSFFEVLLAAGLSISGLYFASFVVYLLVVVCAVIVFEIRKTARATAAKKEFEHHFFIEDEQKTHEIPLRRLPGTALTLIILATLVGVPLFFLLPRVGGAGFGSDQDRLKTSSGFGESVRLGNVGLIQQSDAVVMRVRLDDNSALRNDTHWRGVALDKFDNLSWSRSQTAKQAILKGDRDVFQVDTASGRQRLVTQTVYLEPMNTTVLFGLSRVVGVQGEFPVVNRDSEGGISVPHGTERTSYKLASDRSLPSADRLRADNAPYSSEMENYLQLPDAGVDPRIAKLAADIAGGYSDRYSKAKAIETYLQNNLGYTLEMKARGDQPLADFLFNVKEGHCEYFATAMAIMLRTQRIATRVVNGFQQGEYNDTADVWIVRQRDAHSWVEVYFPKEKAWVPFDPTPFAGQATYQAKSGIFGSLNKYLEALEMYWIQYFVAFDDQEQQSLIRSAKRNLSDFQARSATWMNIVQDRVADWWADFRGDNGLGGTAAAVGWGVAYLAAGLSSLLAFVWLVRKVVKSRVWALIRDRLRAGRGRSNVEFYERMLRLLSTKGYKKRPDETPLEFALAIGDPGTIQLTEIYNRVRFGDRKLSKDEVDKVEQLLRSIRDDKNVDA